MSFVFFSVENRLLDLKKLLNLTRHLSSKLLRFQVNLHISTGLISDIYGVVKDLFF